MFSISIVLIVQFLFLIQGSLLIILLDVHGVFEKGHKYKITAGDKGNLLTQRFNEFKFHFQIYLIYIFFNRFFFKSI